MSHRGLRVVMLLMGGMLASFPMALAAQVGAAPVAVLPTVETEPVPHGRDAADDPAIWGHPTDPARSLIIGTDKQGGLAVYNLAGHQLQYLPDGEINNVDLRYHFPLSGQVVPLVTASNKTTRSLAIYRINPSTQMLENVAARMIQVGIFAQGLCMHRSPVTGKHYAFVTGAGRVEQWELFDAGGGLVDATRVRTFDVGSAVEGCVVDDAYGHLYISEEQVGIWKYGGEPDAGTQRTSVDRTGGQGHLTADVEGLAIYYGPNGTGYLIASSQGDNTFAVYRREGNNAYLMNFTIAAGNGIDGVSYTDGIHVTSVSLGSAFPQGAFVAQDGDNDLGNQNFKLVPWQAIAAELAGVAAAAR